MGTASMTAPSSAISPPTSFVASVATRATWPEIAQTDSVGATCGIIFLEDSMGHSDALGVEMLSTEKWRYVV